MLFSGIDLPEAWLPCNFSASKRLLFSSKCFGFWVILSSNPWALATSLCSERRADSWELPFLLPAVVTVGDLSWATVLMVGLSQDVTCDWRTGFCGKSTQPTCAIWRPSVTGPLGNFSLTEMVSEDPGSTGFLGIGGFSALRFWVSLDVRLPGNHNSHRHKKQELYSSALPNHEF